MNRVHKNAVSATHHLRTSFRNEVLSMMAKHSNRIEGAVRGLMNRYDGSAPNRVGEMLPLLLSEMVDVDSQCLKKIGGAWYALYLYTLLVDEQMDAAYRAKPIEYMAGTALLSSGLYELRSVVLGTPYECIFEQSIAKAIAGQAEDYESSRQVVAIDDRERQSADKNMYLVALASAFAAASGQGEKIIPFVRNFILAVQYLDDVNDYLEDFHSGNFTVLLAGAANHVGELRGDRLELLEDLILSGSLYRVLATTRDALDQALMHVSSTTKKRPILSYIFGLRASIAPLIDDLSKMRDIESVLPSRIEEIEGKLKRIAFSS